MQSKRDTPNHIIWYNCPRECESCKLKLASRKRKQKMLTFFLQQGKVFLSTSLSLSFFYFLSSFYHFHWLITHTAIQRGNLSPLFSKLQHTHTHTHTHTCVTQPGNVHPGKSKQASKTVSQAVWTASQCVKASWTQQTIIGWRKKKKKEAKKDHCTCQRKITSKPALQYKDSDCFWKVDTNNKRHQQPTSQPESVP